MGQAAVKTVWLPGASISVPHRYKVSVQDDGTTVLKVPECQAVVRISLLFAGPVDKSVPLHMSDRIREEALERGLPLEEYPDGKASYTYEQRHPGRDVVMRFWYAGIGNCVCIVSITMKTADVQHADTQAWIAEIPGVIESFELAERTEYIETAVGVVTTKIRSVPQEEFPKYATRPFDKSEVEELNRFLRVARVIRSSYERQSISTDPFSPRELDTLFSAWVRDDSGKRHDPEMVACALGAAFGEILRDAFGMRWQMLTDEKGTAWSMAATRPAFTVFPLDSVRKRIAKREESFFESIYETFRANVPQRRHRRN